MNAKILTLLFVALLAVPAVAQAKEPNARREQVKAHRQAQKEENKAFRETLKEMPIEERKEALAEHRNTQFSENVAFHQQMHQQQMAELQNKLNANTQLTDEQKQAILAKAESEYQQKITQAQARHAANVAFAKQVSEDTTLTPEQKREKIREYVQKNREEMKEHRTEEKEKREARREEFRKKHQEMPEPATK